MRPFVVFTKGLVLIVGLHASSAIAATPLRSGCWATRALALEPALARPTESLRGFRVTALRWDPLLQQQWAIVSSCERPELPSLTLPVPEKISRHKGVTKTSLSIVHSGDVVRVWSQETFVRIEMTGVAEENAALGDRVRIHLLRPPTAVFEGADFAANTETLFGVARGAHEVEIKQ